MSITSSSRPRRAGVLFLVSLALVLGAEALSRGVVLDALPQPGQQPPRQTQQPPQQPQMPPPPLPLPVARPGMSDAEVAAALEAYATELARIDEFSGVVLLAHRESPLLHKAWGAASLRFRVPNQTDTKFNLGSINKAFTKTAIAQLAAEGKIDVDAPVGRYLPDFPPDKAERITVRHLLDHRSGLGDIFVPAFAQAAKDLFLSPKDYFRLFVNEPLAFEPGKGSAYSNAGYMVLGAIIEAVSGRSYFDYVRDRIYRPAGMMDTDAFEASQPVFNQAEGYTRRGPYGAEPTGGSMVRRSNQFEKLFKGSPAGGGYSTATDLARFVTALRAGRVLRPDLVGAVLSREWPASGVGGAAGTSTAAARSTGDSVTLPNVMLAGGAPGTNSVLIVEGDYTVVVLSNYDPPIAVTLGRAAVGLLRGRSAATPR